MKIMINLLFLLSLILFAQDKGLSLADTNVEEKEIGKLYHPSKKWMYDDFVFSEDGFFYTYKDKRLYIWKFLPEIKYIDSFDIGIVKNKKNSSFMHMAANQKILFRTSKSISIWDLKKHKKIIEQKIKSVSGVVVKKDKFVLLDENKHLIKLDLNKLKIIQTGKVVNNCAGTERENNTVSDCQCSDLLYVNNTLNIICENSISCVKSETLEQTGHAFFNPEYAYFSRENTYIHSMLPKSKSINRVNCDTKKINNTEIKLATARNIKRRSFIFQSFLVEEKNFSKGLKVLIISIINKESKNKKRIGWFSHNNNGDWMFKQSGTFNFDTSLSFEKLKMKLADGTISRMNIQTYNKYHQKINLKELKNGKR